VLTNTPTRPRTDTILKTIRLRYAIAAWVVNSQGFIFVKTMTSKIFHFQNEDRDEVMYHIWSASSLTGAVYWCSKLLANTITPYAPTSYLCGCCAGCRTAVGHLLDGVTRYKRRRRFIIMPPPRRGAGALSGDRRPSSVCLSVWCRVHRL